MMRPTSLCRNCRRKTVVLPDGISVMIASSGNSASWRTTNSRNSRIVRSEEHTSELQSHVNLVCRLLLEKKKDKRRKFSPSATVETITKWARKKFHLDPPAAA